MVKRDYIMRLIYEMIRTLLKLVFSIDLDTKEELVFAEKEKQEEYDKLRSLIDLGNINEAENELWSKLNAGDVEYYKMALMFYSHLNEKSVNFLEEHDFSEEEIIDGLKYVSSIYGYENMANTLLEIISE